MFAIIDSRSSGQAINNLQEYVTDLYTFQTNGITGNSISGHPDIFICQNKDQLVVAPNAPADLFKFLDNNNIVYRKGEKNVGHDLDNSVQYNCLSTPQFLFHKSGYTDSIVMEINKDKKFISVPQAYTRCGLVHLCEDNFLTSDRGIEKVLLQNSLSCFYFNPDEIIIKDHKNGFIGGTIGILGNRIFFNGNIELHADENRLKEHLLKLNFEIINLSDEYLYDGGCILFVK